MKRIMDLMSKFRIHEVRSWVPRYRTRLQLSSGYRPLESGTAENAPLHELNTCIVSKTFNSAHVSIVARSNQLFAVRISWSYWALVDMITGKFSRDEQTSQEEYDHTAGV